MSVDAEVTAVAFTVDDVMVGTETGEICRLSAISGK